MTTVSPTPFAASSAFGTARPRQVTSRTLPRAQHPRTELRRNDHFDTFSQGQGFSADAPMLQSISYGDSSDDEIPMPMNFSAQTWAILESKDRSSVGSRSPQREARYSQSRHDSLRGAEQRPPSRAGTPSSRGSLRVSRKSPLPEAEIDRVSPPRVVHLSGSRRSSGLRRTASSAEVRDKELGDADERAHAQEYITPAPAPRKRPVRSRANSSASAGPGSSQPLSLRSLSGPGSSSQGDALSNHEHSAEQGQSNGEEVPGPGPSKATGDALPGSTRLKRLNIGNATFLKGAPMRRALRRRQSEEDQSPRDDDREAVRHHNHDSPEEDNHQPHLRRDSLKPSHEHVRIQDFAPTASHRAQGSQSDHYYEHKEDSNERRSALSRLERPLPTSKPPARSRQGREPQEQSQPAQPVFKMQAPPQLPSFYDQENEPPPTFKRNNNPGMLTNRDKIPLVDERKDSKMLVDTPAETSPQRPALAPRSVNTPQRAAPPPPKMAPLEAPTGVQGASTVKKRKRSHITINGKIFSLKGRLGKGGSSDVYRVMAENDKMFALKKVNLEDCNEETVRGYKGEIDLLKKLENVDRVVRLYDWELNEQKQHLSVLMEIGESDLNRVLSHRLQPEDSRLDLSFVRHYWREMLECVLAVHDHDIVHSDLKPANFLLVQGRLKLIDFGIANAIDTDNTVNVHRETNVGTPNYMSPESLQDTNAEANRAASQTGSAAVAKLMKLGKPSDVWSLGCILYQMTYGKPPFAHIPNQWNRVMAIINPSVHIAYPSTGVGGGLVPASLRRLLQACLNRDAAQRPSIPSMLDEKDAFLFPDSVVDKYENEGAVPVTEHVLEQILNKIVERCRDPKRGVPNTEEMKVYPRAFLDRVREMRGLPTVGGG